MDAADADVGVGEVDEGVAGCVQAVDGGPEGRGLPAPTSPVITPSPRAEMSQRSRATASLQAAEENRAGTGMSLVNGMRVKP